VGGTSIFEKGRRVLEQPTPLPLKMGRGKLRARRTMLQFLSGCHLKQLHFLPLHGKLQTSFAYFVCGVSLCVSRALKALACTCCRVLATALSISLFGAELKRESFPTRYGHAYGPLNYKVGPWTLYSYTVVLAKLPETTYGITWANSRGRVCACWVLSSSQPDCAETVPLPLTHTPAGTRAHTRTRQGRAKPERQRRQLRAKEPWCSC